MNRHPDTESWFSLFPAGSQMNEATQDRQIPVSGVTNLFGIEFVEPRLSQFVFPEDGDGFCSNANDEYFRRNLRNGQRVFDGRLASLPNCDIQNGQDRNGIQHYNAATYDFQNFYSRNPARRDFAESGNSFPGARNESSHEYWQNSQQLQQQQLWQHQPRQQQQQQHHCGIDPNYQRPAAVSCGVTTDIIHEQNSVIESLRMRILELEAGRLNIGTNESSRHTSHMIHSNQLQNSLDHSRRGLDQSRSSTHQNGLYSTLGVCSTSTDDILDLRAKLGAAECELQELQIQSATELKQKDKQIADLGKELEMKSKEICDWSSRFETLTNQLQEEKKQSERQHKYLEKLPTAEEHERNLKTITKLQTVVSVSRRRAEETDKKLSDCKQAVESRDSLIKQLEAELEKTHQRIVELDEESKDLKERLELRPDLVQIQLLRRELDELTAFAESLNKKMETEQKCWAEREKELCDSLAAAKLSANQESECVQTLRTEIEGWAEQVRNCKQTVKQISEERDGWIERCLAAEEKLREAETVITATADRRLLGQLMTDLGRCFNQVKVLISTGLQLCQGEEPDLSALLGLQDTSGATVPAAGGGVAVQAVSNTLVQHWLDDVTLMSRDVDKLREQVINRVAEDYGRNMTCSQQ